MKWDFGDIIAGKKEIDPFLGLSCYMLGFNRHDIVDFVSEKIKNHEDGIEELRNKLYNMSGGYNSIFLLSGAQANEAAIKISREKHQLEDPNRNQIVYLDRGYHGNTFLTEALHMGIISDLDFIHCMSPNFANPPEDWDKVSCFIFETRQWQSLMEPYPAGDNNFSPDNFWKNLKEIQADGVNIIVDDIFFGGGKTGDFFGWKSLPIEPDFITMGKAITGGYFSLSIVMSKCPYIDTEPFIIDSYFSNPGALSCLKYIDILESEKHLDNLEYLQSKTEEMFDGDWFRKLGTVYATGDTLLQVPFNANDEYFEAMKRWSDNLIRYRTY